MNEEKRAAHDLVSGTILDQRILDKSQLFDFAGPTSVYNGSWTFAIMDLKLKSVDALTLEKISAEIGSAAMLDGCSARSFNCRDSSLR